MTRTQAKILKIEGHPMSFEDKSIRCSDCRATFTVSAEKQEFFQSWGYTNEPKCEKARANDNPIAEEGGQYEYLRG